MKSTFFKTIKGREGIPGSNGVMENSKILSKSNFNINLKCIYENLNNIIRLLVFFEYKISYFL
jgi:hypothetical protein